MIAAPKHEHANSKRDSIPVQGEETTNDKKHTDTSYNANQHQNTSGSDTVHKKVKSILGKVLGDSAGKVSLIDQIEIKEIAVFDSDSTVDWITWHSKLKDSYGKEEKPHIIFLAPINRVPPKGMQLQNIIKMVKEHSVAFTSAVGIRGPVAPLSFPAHSVIAVGDPGSKQAGGSTLDFICNSDFSTKTGNGTKQEDIEVDKRKEVDKETAANPWEPAIAAIGITALVLMRAMNEDLGKLFCQACGKNM